MPVSTEPKPTGRLLSVNEVAAETGLSVWTVRELVWAGKLRTVQLPGVRRTFIDRRDLEKAIESWKTTRG